MNEWFSSFKLGTTTISSFIQKKTLTQPHKKLSEEPLLFLHFCSTLYNSVHCISMASTSSTTLNITSSSSLVDAKAPRQSSVASPQCVSLLTLPPPPPVPSPKTPWKAAAYCRKIARNVMAMAIGEATPDVAAAELPEFVKTVQEAWDRVEDKYAVSTLGVAAAVALWGSAGLISAIDRLPVVPGALELVGIGYSGWFAYKNLFYKPDREALIEKIKVTFKDITGSNSS